MELTTDEKLDLVLAKLTAMEIANSKPIVPAEKLGLSLVEAMELTGHKTLGAWYSWAKLWTVRPYRRGHYRRQDIIGAMAKAALPRRMKPLRRAA